MRSHKLILTLIISAVVIIAACIVYSLSPTIRNVSNEPVLVDYLSKPLELKTTGCIMACEKGQYDLIPNVLVPLNDKVAGKLVVHLPIGSVVLIRQFKTYTNNFGSGFTYLYALGDYKQENGIMVSFAYNMGVVTKDLYAPEPYPLGLTLWQDSSMAPIDLYQK